MRAPELTSEQEAAVASLDRDTLVTAGAGTGKTRVLTERFVHIVRSGRAAVDEILALTFTEKAAREMKERIIDRLTSLGREDERRLIETAYVSTIHSFCARVLRENAIEAGVDPYFTQLDEAEAAILQRRAFDALIGAQLRGQGLSLDGLFLAAHHRGQSPSGDSPSALRDVMLSVYAHMRRLGKRPGDLVVAAPPELEGHAREAQSAIAAAMALPPQSKAMRDLIAGLQTAQPRTAALLQAREFDWGAYQELNEIARLFKGSVGTAAQKPVVAQAKESILSFAEALLTCGAGSQAQALREMLAAFDADYSAAKDAEGLLDFDDLLTKTRDLFGTPDRPTPTALAYRQRFKFFMMDEFQDTNRLQMSVVAPLVRPQASFAVGDAKQSIYRFLYADVGVFVERQRRLADEGGACLRLSRSFRSHPDLLRFTNAFFADVWGADAEPAFEPLSAGAQFGERAGPRVELLLAPRAQGMQEARRQEADALARRIGELAGLGESPALMLTEKGNERRAGFGDILVLFRSTSDIQLYEDALGQYDIPYYTVSGRGFYRTQEVQDLRNLLAAIENPLDDVALAAALRSPLVGVSDEALYWLGAPERVEQSEDDALEPQGAGRIASRLARLQELTLSSQDSERLEAFHKLFDQLRQAAAGSQVADVLDQAIRATDYDLKLLCQRNGRRRYANIAKLRQVALGFQSKARFGLRDFLDHLETLQVLGERETEAPTEAEESDVVRLMTIHQAKGLEAPIVVVADLGREIRRFQDAALLSANGELALRLKNPLDDRTAKPADYSRIEQAHIAADRAEDKRLLYVACTRAKEHLLLSGCVEGRAVPSTGSGQALQTARVPRALWARGPFDRLRAGPADRADSSGLPRKARPLRARPCGDPDDSDAPAGVPPDKPYDGLDSWAEWVAKFIGIEAVPPPLDPARDGPSGLGRGGPEPVEGPPVGEVVRVGEVALLVRSDGPALEVEARPRRSLISRWRARLEAGDKLEIGSLGADLERGAQEVARRVSAPAPHVAHVRVSVTAALCYRQCPRRYDLEVVQRLPEPGVAHETTDDVPLHGDDEDPRDRGERLHELLRKINLRADFGEEVERLVEELEPDVRDDARQVLHRFREGPLWQELAKADCLCRETPFIMRLDGATLRGKVDVLLHRKSEWMVADYKTGARRDEHYREQVMLYALACRKLLGATPQRGALYYLDAPAAEALVEFPIDEATLQEAETNLREVVRGISARDFAREMTPACRRCGYAETCRALLQRDA